MLYQRKKIQIGNYNVEVAPLIITIIGIIFLITLGCWQLYRLKEKNAFIASMSRNLSDPAHVYDPQTALTIYQKIKLDGHFLQGSDIHLYGRKAMAPEKEGYYLLSPFVTTKGTVIMIARGWFAAKNKPLIQNVGDSNLIEIIGIVLPLEKQKIFIPNNDLKNNVWFTLKHEEMNSYAQQTLENFYLLQIDPVDLPQYILPISAEGLIKIKNDHLEYALTWFCLAICLGIIFFTYNQKQNKKI
jgi:surfeit locus 1 family protein